MLNTISRATQVQNVVALLDQERYLQEWGSSLDISIRGAKVEVAVHGCTPHELESAEAGWPDYETSRDEYGHTRWVETTLRGIEVTLYYR